MGCLENIPKVHGFRGDMRRLRLVTLEVLYGFRSAVDASFPGGQKLGSRFGMTLG